MKRSLITATIALLGATSASASFLDWCTYYGIPVDQSGDFDLDGMTNLEEFINAGNPTLPFGLDIYGIGFEGWTSGFGILPEPSEDSDLGGVSNLDEYIDGTNPTDPSDDDSGGGSGGPSGFEEWCTLYGIEPDEYADPDGDGKDNQYEYAYNGNPTDRTDMGTAPRVSWVEIDGTLYVELERLERRDLDTEWLYYALWVAEDLRYPQWMAALFSVVSRERYFMTNYNRVVLRHDLLQGEPWLPVQLHFSIRGSGIHTFLGGVYAGLAGKDYYSYPYAPEAPRQIGEVLAEPSEWRAVELPKGDGTDVRVDWLRGAEVWQDPTRKLPEAGYGFTVDRWNDASFYRGWLGKVIPYASHTIYCPKGETLLGVPYPASYSLNELISDPDDGDVVLIWDANAYSFDRYEYWGDFPPYVAAGWYDRDFYPIGEIIEIYPVMAVRYTTDRPKVLTFQGPSEDFWEEPPRKTFLALSERVISTTTGGALFDVFALGDYGTLNYTVSNNVDWITSSPAAGSTSGETDTIYLTVNPAGLSSGIHTGIVTVVSGQAANPVQSVIVELEVEAGAVVGFNAWVENIANTAQRGHADRPDGDGVANLMKYACGFDPGSYVSNLFNSAVSSNASDLVIEFVRAKDVEDALVIAETAGTLKGPWTTTGITLRKTGESEEQETWEATLPCSSNGFIRLKAEMIPE